MSTTMSTTMSTELRTCRLCHKEKEITQFERDKRYQDGHSSRCKACKSALNTKADKAFYRMKSRAEADGVPYNVTIEEVEALFQRFENHCGYCGVEPDEPRKINIDHVIPTSIGGSYNIENLVISCETCNKKKFDMPISEFYFRNKDVFTDERFTLFVHYMAAINRMHPEVYRETVLDEQADYVVRKFTEWCDREEEKDEQIQFGG